MDAVKIRFGQKVKSLRIMKGFSQEKFAELTDLDRTYIPGIETGRRNVSLIVIAKIAKAFNVSIADLMKDI